MPASAAQHPAFDEANPGAYFDAMIGHASVNGRPDAADNVRLAKAFLLDPAFRSALSDRVYAIVTKMDRKPVTRVGHVTRQNGIGGLIAKARARGAVVRFEIDARARRVEGRSLISTVTVSGLRGVGTHPMGVLTAVETLSAALAA